MATSAERDRAERVISLIDLTDLDDRHRADGVDDLVERAAASGTAAVCVWPEFVERCQRRRRSLHVEPDDLRIATVVNFADGDDSLDSVTAETGAALADGADEIDLVLPYRSLENGDVVAARTMVGSIADIVHAERRHLKVILETGELGDTNLIRAATRLAIDEGADFVKSSTGKTPTGATLDAVGAMVDVIVETGGRVGLKPSGGIRTVTEAGAFLDLVDRRLGSDWATPATFRFGASSLLVDAVSALER